MANIWKRTEQADGSHEILWLVRTNREESFLCAELDAEYPYLVQITAGTQPTDDFVGLYDLDGEQIQLGNGLTWELVEGDVEPEVLDQIESGWQSGTTVVERWP